MNPPSKTPRSTTGSGSRPETAGPHRDVPFTSDGVSGASRRLRALAALAGSLTDPLTPKDAADLVEQKALSALDATSAVVVTLGAFPPPVTHAASDNSVEEKALHVLHAIGLPGEVGAALEELPLDAPVPFAQVARDGEPLFLATEDEMRRYPDWAAGMIRAGARAAAIVPVWANGELRGVLGLAWAEPRVFDEDERAFVLTLGVMCAQAIMRAHLRDAEQAARSTAEESNRSKANFVATISHELRTPMNAVLGYTALLADELYGPVNAEQQHHISRVRASGEHLLGLIEDLLSYAQVEAGHQVVRPEPIAVVDIVEESLVMVRPIAEQKGLRIRVEGPSEPLELETDRRKLRQILVNLLANAVKFTETGDVVLVVRVEGKEGEVKVFFEITDTGRGLSAEQATHVFEPFWQADSYSTKNGGSTGLGLSVARQLARMLGGDVIIAKTELGAGSTFTVSMPARYVESDQHPERRLP